MGDYGDFLASKALVVPSAGVTADPEALHPALKDFQRAAVAWALGKGRAALFETTGLGKTLQQLVWGQHAAERTLILAPLAVAQQTVREGERWGIPVAYARSQDRAAPRGLTITNYEMVGHFDVTRFGAVVLDESSILKSQDGKTRTALIDLFRATPMRLCCTATPAPNDIDELGNHAEFLGVMTLSEMRSAFFIHDERGYHLKGHARQAFYRWLASWAISMIRPSDLGFDDAGYDLPPLAIVPEIVRTNHLPAGRLVPVGLKGIQDRAAVRKDTVYDRVTRAAALINADPAEPWIAWVGLNDEGRLLKRLVPDAVLVEGSQSPDAKAEALLRFANGATRVLITKGAIAGMGLNLQRCARMVFVGLSDSFELYFQCIRRCWRYGQEQAVHAHIVLTELEETIYHNVLRKEQEATEVMQQLVQQAAIFEREELGMNVTAKDSYAPTQPMRLPAWLRTVAA